MLIATKKTPAMSQQILSDDEEERSNNHNGRYGNSKEDIVFERGRRDGKHRGGHLKNRKLEMPLFEGIDLDGWILRGEKYFELSPV